MEEREGVREEGRLASPRQGTQTGPGTSTTAIRLTFLLRPQTGVHELRLPGRPYGRGGACLSQWGRGGARQRRRREPLRNAQHELDLGHGRTLASSEGGETVLGEYIERFYTQERPVAISATLTSRLSQDSLHKQHSDVFMESGQPHLAFQTISCRIGEIAYGVEPLPPPITPPCSSEQPNAIRRSRPPGYGTKSESVGGPVEARAPSTPSWAGS